MKFPWNKKDNSQEILKKVYQKSRIKRYVGLVAGILLISIAFNLFLLPNNIVFGGVSGISIITKRLFGWSPSLVIMISSLFLLVVSFIVLGKKQTMGSILGSILFPIFVEITANIGQLIHFDNLEMLLCAIFGINKLMYAIIVVYLIGIMTDKVLLGISDSKAFYIVTEKETEIKDYILNQLGHGVTVFNAKGGYSMEPRQVLLCVVPTSEYFRLKEGIHAIDEHAFFVITDAYEVFGGE